MWILIGSEPQTVLLCEEEIEAGKKMFLVNLFDECYFKVNVGAKGFIKGNIIRNYFDIQSTLH